MAASAWTGVHRLWRRWFGPSVGEVDAALGRLIQDVNGAIGGCAEDARAARMTAADALSTIARAKGVVDGLQARCVKLEERVAYAEARLAQLADAAQEAIARIDGLEMSLDDLGDEDSFLDLRQQ